MTIATIDDLRSFGELARRFAKKELEPRAVDDDRYPFAPVNRAALDAAVSAGLCDALLPEDRGGTGQGIEVFCEVLRELARADGGFATIVFVNALAKAALLEWGPEPLVGRCLSTLIAIPVFDLPNDLPRDAEAKKSGDGWVISGQVEFVPLGPVADTLILPAAQGGKAALFAVDAKSEGVAIGEPILSLGLRNCPTADVTLDKVKAPAGSLLTPDAGVDYPVLAARFRPAAAALAVGVLEGSYDAAKTYAKERYQGGRMIVDYDLVRLMLANLAVVAESGRALVSAMARAVDEGRSWPISDAGLILLTEQASRAVTDGVQCLGGYGYMVDYGQEKRMRDAKHIESIFGAAPQKRLELMAEILRQEE